MNRYHYTDPLSAAWMAKHFGMRFKHIAGGNHSALSLAADARLLAEAHTEFKYVIHPDCLLMLEPKIGDYICLNGKCFGSRGRITAIGERGFKLSNGTAIWWAQHSNIEAIEQRKSKPFLWPERNAP